MAESIYRYKLAEDIYEIIIGFAKLHQFDARKDYKEAWKSLVEAREVEFTAEKERLSRLGYKGDVLDKMYKSGRYYFKGKSSSKHATSSPKPRTKNSTIKLSKGMLETITKHINLTTRAVKPSDGFELFCRDEEQTINAEVERVGIEEKDLLMTKIKKSYKNRYFTIQKKKDI
jgi:hypothetical protein